MQDVTHYCKGLGVLHREPSDGKVIQLYIKRCWSSILETVARAATCGNKASTHVGTSRFYYILQRYGIDSPTHHHSTLALSTYSIVFQGFPSDIAVSQF